MIVIASDAGRQVAYTYMYEAAFPTMVPVNIGGEIRGGEWGSRSHNFKNKGALPPPPQSSSPVTYQTGLPSFLSATGYVPHTEGLL